MVRRLAAVLLSAAITAGCEDRGTRPPSTSAVPPGAAAAAARAAIEARDRSDADRALDAGRHPVELLTFFGTAPGMRVAELGAGGGYTTELLARAVGPTGRVYGQNSQLILDRFAQAPWTARLATPPMRNVVRLDRPFDDPFPPDVRDLDQVWLVLFYHDTVWQGVDRARMNRRVFEALRPGGVYAVIDHSGRPRSGAAETESLHRIEESVVIDEVQAAGFRLDATSDVLRNPADPRDWNDSPRAAGERRGTSDRFVLRFVKPA
jgi:predicted methyltransferase